MQIRCNFPDISYLSETQKNNFQFLSKQIGEFVKHLSLVKVSTDWWICGTFLLSQDVNRLVDLWYNSP